MVQILSLTMLTVMPVEGAYDEDRWKVEGWAYAKLQDGLPIYGQANLRMSCSRYGIYIRLKVEGCEFSWEMPYIRTEGQYTISYGYSIWHSATMRGGFFTVIIHNHQWMIIVSPELFFLGVVVYYSPAV